MASPVTKALDVTVDALPLMGTKYWVALAAELYHDRVSPDFTLAPFPRRGEGEAPVMPAHAVTAPRPKSRTRRAA
jgi:hypothetical protein